MIEGWITAPLPENEAKRLEALYKYDVLDTLPEESFDRITRLASSILKTPIALVSLVDKERQWFKSHHGIDATETSRELAFCAHAILKNEVLLVPDATKDPRFSGNPLVTGAPDIRFYAGAPLKNNDGLNIGTLCLIDTEAHHNFSGYESSILSDLAAMVIDELELRVAVKKANLANQAKSDFLSNMRHEIRTPMNGIIGMTELLLESELNNSQKIFAKTVMQSAEYLMQILNDILDFSKIEAGKMELQNTQFNMRTLCLDVLKLFTLKCREKKIALSFIYNAEESVIGDSGRIRQILLNLLSNAIKFTEKGDVKIDVRQLEINSPDKIKFNIAVKDTGIGISKEQQVRLFNKFSQVDPSSTRKFGGTGLGLAICKELTKMMGGDVDLQSAEGKGSTFTATIVLEKGDVINTDNITKPSIADDSKVPNKLAHILLVEDNRINMMFAKETLKSLGYKISTAINGIEAVNCFKEGHYELIFMDCQMPQMDGYEATREIRKLEQLTKAKETIVIALTANAMKGDEEKCLNAGMNGYISKPVRKNDLQAVLNKWLT